MKTSKIFLTAFFACCIFISASAQTNLSKTDKTKNDTKSVVSKSTKALQTAIFKVSGNCESCKSRIEKAAKTAGAKQAVWDAKTQTITVSFDPQESSIDKISKAIAAVGHDAGKYKADAKTYNALPGCCKYDRTK